MESYGNPMSRIIIPALVALLVSGPVWAQGRNLLKKDSPSDLMLVCKGKMDLLKARYYLLQPANNKARKVDGDTAIEGKLEVRETIYIMYFPKEMASVNRYSGRMVSLYFTEPYIPTYSDKFNKDAVYSFSTCKESSPQRRF